MEIPVTKNHDLRARGSLSIRSAVVEKNCDARGKNGTLSLSDQ